MSPNNPSIEMIEVVAQSLGPLLEQVVFVGGATAGFYLDSGSALELRPTDDVDCVIAISGPVKFAELEQQLRSLGFTNDRNLICRWEIQGIKVDMMPTDPAILGFSSRWYETGIKNRQSFLLPNGTEIAILPLAYFIACKLEAMRSRGGNDWRTAHDLEDVLIVLDGCNDPISETHHAANDVKAYLAESCGLLLSNESINDILAAHLGHEGPKRIERAKKILAQMTAI